MWELNYKESWGPKNGCFWTVVLEETLESPLDCKEIISVNPKVNKPWILTGRTDAEAEAFWSPDGNSRFTGKFPYAGKIEGKRREHQRMRWLDGITNAMYINMGKLQERWGTGRPGVLQSMGLQSWTWLGDWTTATMINEAPFWWSWS